MNLRIVGHLDMDAFFAAIEERDNPRLVGLPIVVGADPMDGHGRGVVSTANYAARKYGIRSALPIATAWRYSEAARKKGLRPAVFIAGDMHKYGEESARVMGILRAHVALVEQASVDEAYFEVGEARGTYGEAEKLARVLKAEIFAKEKLTASVGLGPNKLVAKIASDRQKPDGLTVVRGDVPGAVEAFLAPLSIRVIPGVGPKTEEKFKALGIRTVEDARRFSVAELTGMMGKWGAELYRKLRGEDDAPLVTEWEVKSVSEQETFEEDVPVTGAANRKKLESALASIAKDVFARFMGEGFKSFRHVTVTVRFADFTTFTHGVTLKEPVMARDAGALATLQFQALRLFMPYLDRQKNPSGKAIRLLGVRVEKLG